MNYLSAAPLPRTISLPLQAAGPSQGTGRQTALTYQSHGRGSESISSLRPPSPPPRNFCGIFPPELALPGQQRVRTQTPCRGAWAAQGGLNPARASARHPPQTGLCRAVSDHRSTPKSPLLSHCTKAFSGRERNCVAWDEQLPPQK